MTKDNGHVMPEIPKKSVVECFDHFHQELDVYSK